MPKYESSDSDDETTPQIKLFGRERSMHAILGGGKGILSMYSLSCFVGRKRWNEGKCFDPMVRMRQLVSYTFGCDNFPFYFSFLSRPGLSKRVRYCRQDRTCYHTKNGCTELNKFFLTADLAITQLKFYLVCSFTWSNESKIGFY